MNWGDSQADELFELASRLREEQLTTQEELKLTQILREDGGARQAYAEYLALMALLELEIGVVATTKAFVGDSSKAPAAVPPPAAGENIPSASGNTPILGFLGNIIQWGESLPGVPMFLWMLAGFVGMVVGLPTIMAILAIFGFYHRPVAQLAAAADCQWTHAAAAIPVGSELRPGQKIDLVAGEAQIIFQRGAVLTVHGPSILEIESDACARLLVGDINAKAETERSHGFTLRLPTASVVELGTEFRVQAAADGHSRVDIITGAVELRTDNGDTKRRLEKGQAVQLEPGKNGVFAIVEAGDKTPAWRFPTIEPPSDKDYADASQHHAKISVVEGRRDERGGPAELLLDGRAQSKPDSALESVFFDDASRAGGKFLLDLGKTVRVQKINTYSWHESDYLPRKAGHTGRAPQRYALYGFAGDAPPPVKGDPAEHGWTRICRIDTDEFFSVPPAINRPQQQAVSISGATGEVGRYRFLLWAVLPSTPADVPGEGRATANTAFGEFDVYAEERD